MDIGICGAQESKKKTSADPDPGLGKLSRQIDDPESYMRELAGRLNSSGGQQLLTRGMPKQGWRPSSSQTTTAPASDSSKAPLGNDSATEISPGESTSRGLSPAPTQTRFGWNPGSGPAATAANEMAQLRFQSAATGQTWMSPSERARQLDPLAAASQMQSRDTMQTTPPESAPIPRGWVTPGEQASQPSLDGTRVLGQDTSMPTVDARTWMSPADRMSQPSLDGARLLGTSPPSTRKEPWQYATPSQTWQTPQNQMMQTAPGGVAMPTQNPYAAQAAPQQWPSVPNQTWQTPQSQMAQTAPNGMAMPAQNPYAAQAAPQQQPAVPNQTWQTPQNQMMQTAPGGTAMPTQNPYAAQAAPPWPAAAAPTIPSAGDQTTPTTMGELETIYPGQPQPLPASTHAASMDPAGAGWGSQPGGAIAQDSRPMSTGGTTQTMPTPSQADLTQTWLSSKNRAAQAALEEIRAGNQPQSTPVPVNQPARSAASIVPTAPTVPTAPVATPEMGPTPGSQAARTVVNGSQARHFYEEKEPAWSLGADLDKYRNHAVNEGSRDSGESLKKALGGIGLAIEDTTNIITLGYASDRAKPFRANDGKGFFDEPGRVPKQAGITVASLGHGLYSVADLVTFNALPDNQKEAYIDNHPLIRPLVFTGQTIGGVWKTTEEIGNALTWGYFDNVAGSIGMCIESLIEALKHTGQAVTNLARVPVRLISGNNEKADKALDWVLLVPLEMASNVVQMKGIANMDDYKTAFADKGVIGSVFEFGGSTFLVYRAVDKMLDELDNNKRSSRKSGNNNGGSSGGSTPEFPADVADPPGAGIIFWWEDGWPTVPVEY